MSKIKDWLNKAMGKEEPATKLFNHNFFEQKYETGIYKEKDGTHIRQYGRRSIKHQSRENDNDNERER